MGTAEEVEEKRSRPYTIVKRCSLYPLVPTDLPELPDVLYGAGDVGESVYGEKADMRPLLGEGIKGDCTAIMMMRNGGAEYIESCSTPCSRVAVRARNGQVFVDGEGLQAVWMHYAATCGGILAVVWKHQRDTEVLPADDGRVQACDSNKLMRASWIKSSREVIAVAFSLPSDGMSTAVSDGNCRGCKGGRVLSTPQCLFGGWMPSGLAVPLRDRELEGARAKAKV